MTNRISPPPVGALHESAQFQTWYSLIAKWINYLLVNGGGGSGNLDGGSATSVYGGTTGIDGGSA